MEFVVIDVETANADYSSICQVGIASFRDSGLADTWESLVNPEDYFSPVNISIHGIDEHMVQDSPTWRGVFPQINSRLRDEIVVSHSPFDRVAIERACERADMAGCVCRWLDSVRVARIAWPELSISGFKLSSIADHFGIEFQAHDALEDARCAGLLLLRAVEETGLSPEQWLVQAERPIHSDRQMRYEGNAFPPQVKRCGNPSGRLCGEVVVFTGSLSISREDAAEAAADAGCRVDDGVTKHTTLLVVGDQDLRRLAGHDKSTKQRKAERLIDEGQHIRIIGESDFNRIVSRSEIAEDAEAQIR
ncbi:MAG: exonuclease domain-containing protein [Terracidiphilus sp.]